MPSLLHVEHFKGDKPRYFAPLYFKDAYMDSRGSRDWRFEIQITYPYIAYIHCDDLDAYFSSDDHGFWVDMRRWVERCAAGDVIIEYKNMTYKWQYVRNATSEYKKQYSDVKHGYWHFYFEAETDLHMFLLKYGEIVTLIKEQYHPDYGADVFDQDRIYNRSPNKVIT